MLRARNWKQPQYPSTDETKHSIYTYEDQSCPTPCDPVDCSPPGFSVHGISQARVLEWVAISYSRGSSSRPRDWTHVSCVSCIGRWILYHCATWKALKGCQDPLTFLTNGDSNQSIMLSPFISWKDSSKIPFTGFLKFQGSQTSVNHSDGQLSNPSYWLSLLPTSLSRPRLLLSKNYNPKQTLCMQAFTLGLTFRSTQYKTFGIRCYFSNSRDANNWFINHISKATPFQANPELASKSLGFLKIFPTKELIQPKELSFTTFPV